MAAQERGCGWFDATTAEPAAKSPRHEPVVAVGEAVDSRQQQQQRSRAKTAAAAIDDSYVYPLWAVQQQRCICKMQWCVDAQRRHVLGKKTVQLPDNLVEARKQMLAYNTHARPAERLTEEEIKGYCDDITMAQASTPIKGMARGRAVARRAGRPRTSMSSAQGRSAG